MRSLIARALRGLFALVIIFLVVLVLAWRAGYLEDLLLLLPSSQSADAVIDEDELLKSCYVYTTLDEADRERYRAVMAAMQTRHDQRVPASTTDQVTRIRDCVFADHPELQLSCSNIVMRGRDAAGGTMQVSSVRGEFIRDEAETQACQAHVDAVVNDCLAGLPEGADDYAVAKYLYEWMVEHVTYDHEVATSVLVGLPVGLGESAGAATQALDRAHTLEGALLDGSAVCDGYSRAFQYLMRTCGVECTYLTGSSMGEDHAWCFAKLDGEYYYIDPTWGDPQTAKEGTARDAGYVNYDYLNIGYDQMLRTHAPDSTFPIPTVTGTADNYYEREGLVFQSADVDYLAGLAQQAFDEGHALQIRCVDEWVYQELRAALADATLAAYLDEGTYSYSYSDENLSLTVFGP